MPLSYRHLFEVIACPEQILSKSTGALFFFFSIIMFTKVDYRRMPTDQKAQQEETFIDIVTLS